MVKRVVVVVVALVVVGGAAFWWFVLRSDPPPELSVDGGETSTAVEVGDPPATLDGTWRVVTGGDTTAGLRIDESFAGGLADHTAVGRSTEVSGSLAISGTEVTGGSFTVDLTKLEFTDDPGRSVANRANAMRSRGLETSRFPEATFAITEPVDFGSRPDEGEVVTLDVTGELTLHGVTRPVTVPVEAKLVGDTLRIATADPVPVVLADYDIDKPTGGPIAAIDDAGSFEFLVVLEQA